ncbi:MAG: heme-binding protein [Pseudomonadota bacterium]|nr:heme-binding protein [Pseudomonadota bacterium]
MADGNQKPLVQSGLLLTEAAGLHLLEVAVAKAEELGIKATVAVVDPSGRLLAFVKMAGSFLVSSELARKKAVTAAGMGMDTVELETVLNAEPPRVLSGLTRSENFTVIGGGVPLVRDNHIVGGIGVSGGSEEQDIECAQAAARLICT